MRRRDFIVSLGGLALAWPAAGLAQKSEGLRRIGVLMPGDPDDPQTREREAVFRQALLELGWRDGRNVSIEVRWASGDLTQARKLAVELVGLAPDVILGGGGLIVPALRQTTRAVPIVFAQTIDPVGLGLVSSLARPGGNMTGFINMEFSFSAKWLELLKQIAPRVLHVGVLRDPGFRAQFAAIEAAATPLHVKTTPIDMHDADQISRAITAFAAEPDGGLIMTMSTRGTFHRDLIVALAARAQLPAVYPVRFDVLAGGLISYGPIFLDQYRRAADYVDRILRGAKAEELPVQAPTKYEMVLNLTAARDLGLTVPRIVLGRVDELIE